MASIASLILGAVKSAPTGAFRAQTFSLSDPRSAKERFAAAKAREMATMISKVADLVDHSNALIGAVSSALKPFVKKCAQSIAARARVLREAFRAARAEVEKAAAVAFAAEGTFSKRVGIALAQVAQAYARVNLASAGITLQGLRRTPIMGVFEAAKGKLKACLQALHACVALA